MKRLLLLPPALGLLLTATPAFALSAQCQTVLSLPPVSPYVKAVLQRADKGLDYIESSPGGGIFGYGPIWTQTINSAWSALLSTNVVIKQQSEDLTNDTACLNFDRVAVQCEMDKVRDAMNDDQTHSLFSIVRLQLLLTFLSGRLDQLDKGALDPQYRDPDWGTVQGFDPPQNVYCARFGGDTCTLESEIDCNASGGNSFRTLNACLSWGGQNPSSSGGQASSVTGEEEMCPYDSDYAPPIENGFGCDTGAMLPLTKFPPVKAEYDAQSAINKAIDKDRQQAAQLLGVQADIDNLFGTSTQTPPPLQPRKHLTASGCKWTGGLCAKQPSTRCTQNSDCGQNDTCQTPTNICKGNRNITCFTDAQCLTNGQNVGPCIPNDGKAAAIVMLRGPFSINKNELGILSQFLAQRLEQATSRQFPDYLQTPAEKAAQSPPSSSAPTASPQPGFFESLVDGSMRQIFSAWSAVQGRNEAVTFPESADPQLEVANALSPLRQAVGDLAMMATDKQTGLRSFVIKYAYFLDRSCIYRPCNASLTEVLKIAFADACFPYTNGQYLEDTPADPRWQQCAAAAGITLP